jgi:glutathione S-transferase
VSELTIVIGTRTYSSWSLRGWLAARHTGLPLNEILLPLDTPEFYERIAAYSPTRCVPALLHGDARVWDSLAIIDYCARTAPGKHWWPQAPAAYAMARSVTAEMHSGFTALRAAAPMNLRGRWTGLALADAVAKDVTRIDAIWSEARGTYGGAGDFLFGEFGAADMMYAPVVARFLTYDIATGPVAKAYMDAVRQHPYVREWYDAAAAETQIVDQDQLPADITRLG